MAKNMSIRFTPSSSLDDDEDGEYENSISFNDCSDSIVEHATKLTAQFGSGCEISNNNRNDDSISSRSTNEAPPQTSDNYYPVYDDEESMVNSERLLMASSCYSLNSDQPSAATTTGGDNQLLTYPDSTNTDDLINHGNSANLGGNNNSNNSNSVFNFIKKNKSSGTTGGAKVSKVDKFVRHLQESFTSTSPVPRQSDSVPVSSVSKSTRTTESGAIGESSANEEDSVSNNSVEAVLPPTSASNQSSDRLGSATVVASTTSPSPTTPTTSWYNDMKLVNSIREKWRSDKKNADDTASSISSSNNNNNTANLESDSRKGSLSSRRLSSSSVCCSATNSSSQVTKSQLSLHCNSCSKDSDSRCGTPNRQPSPLPPYLPYEIVYYPDADQLSMTDENSNNTMTNDKETSKKSKEMKDLMKKNKLIAASNKKKSSDSSLTANKLTKPKSSKSQISPSTTNASTSFASFLSIIAPPCSSTSKITSDMVRPHSSSFENLTASLYNENTNQQHSPVLSVAPASKNFNKPSKLPSSKSMVSFRKMKNGTEEILIEESSDTTMPNNIPVNPTIRRKTIAEYSVLPETISPTVSLNDDTISLSSSTSSIETATDALSLQDSLNQSNLSNSMFSFCKPTLNVSKPNWNSALTPSISHAYYFFSSVVAFISVIFCLISPLPSFFNGFILGLLCTFLLVSVVIVYVFSNYILIKSNDSDELPRRAATPESVSLKRNRSKKLNSTSNNSQFSGDLGKFTGWVYEFIGEYEERETNGFVSRPVSVTLYDSKLHLYTPSQEMSEKKLKQHMTDTSKSSALNFSSQRIIDFSKLNHKRLKLLLTKNVRNQRKYIWSKKYPICLEFNDDRLTNGGGYHVNGKETPTSSNPPSPAMPKKLESSSDIIKLVIFARTCREKEEWFWALKNTIDATLPSKALTPSQSHLSISSNNGESNSDISAVGDSNFCLTNSAASKQYLHILTKRVNYSNFMRTNVLNAEGLGAAGPGMMTPLTWFNVLINRLSFDILNKPNWSAYIAKKLQRKLRRLRLPYFLESLTITEIDIGTTLPKFNSVPSVPVVDEAGLWIDFDVNYSGGFTMTLETKINLLKIKGLDSTDSLGGPTASAATTPDDASVDPLFEKPKLNPGSRHWRGYKYRTPTGSNSSNNNLNSSDLNEEFAIDSDSDLDSIVTSSEDEEPETAPADPDDADTDEKQKKLIRFVNKITTSQYFQKATQINFFKKALEGVSNMSIMLTVQINSLSGTLAINIPETPSDRLWYGFRNDPIIQITARPKLGDHDVNLNYVTNFIEKKLRAEFFNYFVIPNMDDFFIPALNTNIEQNISVVP